jgi:hypothetical protein
VIQHDEVLQEVRRAPARSWSGGATAQVISLLQDLAGHDDALDLVGALVDLSVLGCGSADLGD